MSIFDELDQIKDNFEVVLEKLHNHKEECMAVNIIIDDADPQNPIFIEVENDNGEGIGIGQDLRTKEGYRRLRLAHIQLLVMKKYNQSVAGMNETLA